ncbi:MAG: ABC transporter ATP-binding protein [Candidatus Omnitrophica bacterium]|nr:ABC transporter ATP-binding protein [Candidatus Omnitrophota bacterium]
MIKLDDVTKYFYSRKSGIRLFGIPEKTVALDSVNISFAENTTALILGANGAGKTTLLKTIAGLILPDKGSVLSPRGDMSFLSSEMNGFYPQLTARENLSFFISVYGIDPEEAAGSIDEYSEKLGIPGLDTPFWHSSTGNKRKLLILRTLILDRKLILLDEPMKSLDNDSTSRVCRLLGEIRDKRTKTILIAAHSADHFGDLPDSIVHLDRGRTVAR